MRTLMQKRLGKIVRSTNIAASEKCSSIEKLFGYNAEDTICNNCGRHLWEHFTGKTDGVVGPKWCTDDENSNKKFEEVEE